MNKDLFGDIKINFHASIRIKKNNLVLYFDPYKITNEISLNDADYVFITHGHYDHFSKEDIKKVMKYKTKFIAPLDLKEELIDLGVLESNMILVEPGATYKLDDISFDTIASYNVNKDYHKKEYNWVGYNVLLDGNKYYVIGDSDFIPEMNNVDVDVLFVPVGGTYTMNYNEAAFLTNKLKPKYAIPIHYGEVGNVRDARNFIESINDNINGLIIGG